MGSQISIETPLAELLDSQRLIFRSALWCARSTVPLRETAPVPFLSTSTSCVPSGASDTVACHARRERESAEVAKAAAQLLSREPRVFISRPNVRGTLVAVEKAASHSVSLFTIYHYYVGSQISIQARLVELLDSEQLSFPFRIINYNNYYM